MATHTPRSQGYNLPQPLIVQLKDKPDKTPTPIWITIVAALLILVLIVVLLIWLMLTSFQSKSVSTPDLAPISARITLDLPTKITVRDSLPLSLTIVNTSNSALDLTVTLAVASGKDFIFADDGTSTFVIEDLPPGGSFTHTFKVILLNSSADKTLDFAVFLYQSTVQQSLQLADDGWKADIWSWPPHLRSIINYILTGSGLMSSALLIFYDRLRKSLDLA